MLGLTTMKFFPPSQLPAMRRLPSEPEEAPAPLPPVGKALRVVISFALGAVVAALGFWCSSSLVWFAAAPVSIALGWAFANEPFQRPRASPNRRGGGPVLW